VSRGRSGPLSSNWVGDQVGYKARHTRVVRARGAAKTHDCAHCAEAGAVTPAHDWATRHGTIGLNVNDYLPLCRRCHQAYDGITDAAVALFQSDEHRARVQELWADPEWRSRHQGVNRGNAVLTDFIVGRSRHDSKMGKSVASLARQFGVKERALHTAVAGQTWRHVPDPYRLLADAVIARLNPRDGDEAEVSLLIAAVARIAAYVQSLPCTCKPGPYDGPCGRCAALGQWNGEPQ
jgi:hypothetical protein